MAALPWLIFVHMSDLAALLLNLFLTFMKIWIKLPFKYEYLQEEKIRISYYLKVAKNGSEAYS